MKRIQSACLEQTIRFLMKEDVPASDAQRLAKEEYQHYLQQLERGRTAYRVLSEETQSDGSLVVKLRRQYNSYQVGDYLD